MLQSGLLDDLQKALQPDHTLELGRWYILHCRQSPRFLAADAAMIQMVRSGVQLEESLF